jgi:hypothetical protein
MKVKQLKYNRFKFLFSVIMVTGLLATVMTGAWAQDYVIGGINLGKLPDYLFFFENASSDANWQGASKGFVGDVAVDGIQASERTSGGVPYGGTIYTNDVTLSAWQDIVDQNDPPEVDPAQAWGITGETARIAGLETDLINAFTQINALSATPGYTSVSSTSLNGLNTQNGIPETYVINITSGLSFNSQINITGDAADVFILRWDIDGDPSNGYQGQANPSNGGAIVPQGGLRASNFINLAGDIDSWGCPPPPYPQGPRYDDGQGALIVNGSDFGGGGYFTGYWLTTGKPDNYDPVTGLYYGESSDLSNGIFVGGWYTINTRFSMTSGTSGVYVSPNPSSLEQDYGDAPSPYPTLFAPHGAQHVMDGVHYLGNSVDSEPDGQPDPNAFGDDNDIVYPPINDDEDGVTFTSPIVQGQTAIIEVTASASGILNAWLDFNGDGDWADAGEQIFVNQALVAGVNNLSFNVPAGAKIGQTYARFRFSTVGNLNYEGLAPDGEVEDYMVTIEQEQELDFGDAPTPYPTLLVQNGARHVMDGVHYLGISVDVEPNGQPDPNALGDDNDIVYPPVNDDEDGVTFPATLVLGGTANITVTASAPGILNAWLDFNGDGDWADPGEQIFINQALVAGANALSFNIPANAAVGATFARFRFSTVGGLSYDGLAPDGEVEDYKVEINEVDFGDAPDPNYPTLLISNGARHIIDGVHYLGAGVDPDTDGQPDATATGDDNDTNDDEDGVTFIGLPLIQFSTHTVQVVASASGYLNAWMDFNQDGDWDDPNEHIIVDQLLSVGPNNVIFSIPLINDTPPHQIIQVISRFRFSTQQGLSYDGLAPNGEVEDYMVDVQIPVELTTFAATSASGAVTLAWATQSESENLGYHVYRSMVEADGYVRITKETIKGAGNSTDTHNYSYTDSDVKSGNKYYYKLCSVDYIGNNRFYGPISVTVEGTTSVKEDGEVVATNYSLDQNYPNPFNPETAIAFSLKEAGQVSLKIYNIQGQVVRTLVDQQVAAGKYAVMWNGTNDLGVRLVSGVYFYSLQVNGFKETRKLNLMK